MLYTIKVFYVSNKTLMLPNDKEKSVTISHNSSDAHTTGARSVTRRNLTRGALWAVPAIAASTTVPACLMSVYEATHGPEGDLNLNCGEFVMTYNVSALEATTGTTHLHPSMDIYLFSPEGQIIDRQVFTTDPTGVATVMTRNGKTQTVQGQVIPFASSVNDKATGISARFALRGNTFMEGMYQFEVVITVPTIQENGTVDTNKQVNAIAFTPPTFNTVS